MKVRIFSKRLLMPFSDLRPKLRLHFAHMRFGKQSSSCYTYPTERLSLMLVFPGYVYQTMVSLLYGGYKPQRIRKEPMLFSLTAWS